MKNLEPDHARDDQQQAQGTRDGGGLAQAVSMNPDTISSSQATAEP